jgi:hypothetical protein
MAKYCITAANHKNPNNHVASSFKVYVEKGTGNWDLHGKMSAKDVVELIEHGHTVLTGKIEGGHIYLGAPVEVELRIAKNETQYPISTMPPF